MNIMTSMKVFFAGGADAYAAKNIVKDIKQNAKDMGASFAGKACVYFATSQDTNEVKWEVFQRVKHLAPFAKETKIFDRLVKEAKREFNAEKKLLEKTRDLAHALEEAKREKAEYHASYDYCRNKEGEINPVFVDAIRRYQRGKAKFDDKVDRAATALERADGKLVQQRAKFKLVVAELNSQYKSDERYTAWKKLYITTIAVRTAPGVLQLKYENGQEVPVLPRAKPANVTKGTV